jgi:hypothetical protein
VNAPLLIISSLLLIPPQTPIERLETYLYQYLETNTLENGLVLDRDSNRGLVSIAATGLAFPCWAENSLEDPREAVQKIKTAIFTILKNNPRENRGWISHYLDVEGKPVYPFEISTLDTAILWAGVKRAAEILNSGDLRLIFAANIFKIDVPWMIESGYLRHGFYNYGGKITLIPYVYGDFSEAVIAYDVFNVPFKPAHIEYNLPLFCYYYPIALMENKEDLEGHLLKAIDYQKSKYKIWGVTSGDSATGYEQFNPEIISPLTINVLNFYLEKYKITESSPLREPPANARFARGDTISLRNNFSQSLNVLTLWQSEDKIGIDQAASYLLLKQCQKKKGKNGRAKKIPEFRKIG